MRLIKPYTEICKDFDGEETLKKIERVARTCYKSEDKIKDNKGNYHDDIIYEIVNE